MRCLADTDLARFIDGTLPPEMAVHLDAHIDRCERCFALVAAVWRGNSAVQSPRSPRLPDAVPVEESALPAAGRRYLVLGLLGQGGMGQVYRAFDRLTGQTVALKRVISRRAGSRLMLTSLAGKQRADAYVSCLGQEFRILATLRHPNIISVLDFGFDEELEPFYTMELLEGARTILPFAQALPQPARIELLIQLLQALSYLHRRGILHRDLKPSYVTTSENHQLSFRHGCEVLASRRRLSRNDGNTQPCGAFRSSSQRRLGEQRALSRAQTLRLRSIQR